MTLLVTGGAGFMGSYFIKYVLKQKADWNVINVDKLTYSGDTTKLKDIEDDYRYQFVEEDITNGEQMEHLVSYYGVDGIINFAAETHVDNSIDHADPFITTNITGTHTLLEVARKYGTRIVQVSTDEVYGSIQEGRVTEDAPFAPNSPYAASKASADLLCRAYHQTYGVDFVGSHACNVLGPYQYPEKFIPTMLARLENEQSLPLYGDGLYVREWMYVEDHAQAILLLFEEGKSGERYNISTEEERSNKEVINRLLDEYERDASAIEYVEDRKGHDRRYAVDSSKIRNLGWAPQHGFAESLSKVMRWYKHNQTWWQKALNNAA